MLELSQLQRDDVFRFLGSPDKYHVLGTVTSVVIFVNLNNNVMQIWDRSINFIEYELIMRNGKVL
jgi:hypothetical protein